MLSTISTVLEYLDDSIKIYDTHNSNALKLPITFNLTRNHLPTLRRILQLYKSDLITNNIKSKPSDICEHLRTPLESCEINAWKIKQIFERVFPADDPTWEDRYTKCIGIFGGTGNNIEEVMFALTGIVQSMICDYAVGPVRPGQVVKLEGIRVEMKSV